MQDAVKTRHDHQKGRPKLPLHERRWFQVSLAILLLAVLVLGLIWIGRRFRADDLPQFVTGNLLNALIFTAIVGQVLIYRRQRDIMQRQWESMERQLRAMRTQSGHQEGQLQAMAESLVLEQAKTDPRLRVSKIRVENFGAGKSPIFIVTIANSGLIAATGVEIHIGIAVGMDKEFNWITPQTVIIPARSQESYPVNSGMIPDEQLMHSLTEGTIPIEVKVRLKYWPRGEVEFCYKYFPWPRGSERPDDIPQFFPCDFKANVNVVVHLKGIEMKLTGFPVSLIHGKAPRDEKTGDKQNCEEGSG